VYFILMGVGASVVCMTLLSLPMDPFHKRMMGFGLLAVLIGAVPLLRRDGRLDLFFGLVTGVTLEQVTSTVRDVWGREGSDGWTEASMGTGRPPTR
jgi:hypothetical protein